MHKKFTLSIRRLVYITALTVCGLILQASETIAQTSWSGVYGNEWIDYTKRYVKIPVAVKGLHKIPFANLPNDFPKNESDFQLWHRGKEVAIISTSNNEILFYGEPNDGKSDELMFRPSPAARLNPYVSLFSDLGAYFLTSKSGTKRAISVDGTSLTGAAEQYHFQTDVTKFASQFASSTEAIASPLNHSYYDESNSWTGPSIFGAFTTGANKISNNSFQLKNWVSTASDLPVLELLINGLHNGNHAVNISIGKTDADADQGNVTLFNFSGFGGRKVSNFNIPADKISPSGTGIIQLKSNTTSDNTTDRFALSFYAITYPQLTDMAGLNSVQFNFKASSQAIHLSISNSQSGISLYDISNIDEPKIISGNLSGSTFEAMVPRTSASDVKVFASLPADIKTIAANQITDVTWTPYHALPTVSNVNSAIDPASYDYLIVTNSTLKLKAIDYASYRNSSAGGNYKTLIYDVKDIYNQFNYGEPSAVAIKRFVDYMTKSGIRTKHNLVLIGNNVTLPSRLQKEMPDEVPTFGDPGSDVLLVTGLNGFNQDVPSIPVGRIPAFYDYQITAYLEKVKTYESETSGLSWRKKVLHIAGGKTVDEQNDFVAILDDVAPIVKSDNSRSVQNFTTASPSTNITPANITTNVNNGVGMITYYGHGSPNETLLNVGLVSKPSGPTNNYSSTGDTYSNTKYPIMYFNGCGVGNLFSRNSQQGDVLSRDWLLTSGKGSIAMIASSFNSYVSPTITYLETLYGQLFAQKEATMKTKTMGQIHRNSASLIITGSAAGRVLAANDYDITNIHQANLIGDPAIVVLNSFNPLPVGFINISAKLSGTNQVTIDWQTAWEINNSHFIIERSYNAKNFVSIGSVEGKGDVSTQSDYSFVDNQPLEGLNYYRIRQVDRKDGSAPSSEDSFSRIVSIKTSDIEQSVVYPNPTKNVVDIKLNTPTTLKSWSILNNSGKVLGSGTKSHLSLQNYPTGVYILDIVTENGDVYHKKIVKE
ncbi:C25 family cysteine peptidase [Dyadobacter sp. CY356]|uniref:putative type IX secretion system sortase PorU2 n=1 Tax=Dyadobacter sp. CY356 TaxID=2906442 RepID=UPI001F44DD17|nr:C25 family cysteine peptidase [Dyadobacter sp. CY356]MCF0058375.1 C25 family cysteine peptidase [Dyadobacter sp. CY356]